MSAHWTDGFLAGVFVFLGLQSLQQWYRRRQEKAYAWLAVSCAGALGVNLTGRVVQDLAATEPAGVQAIEFLGLSGDGWLLVNGAFVGLTVAGLLGNMHAIGGRIPARWIHVLQGIVIVACAIGNAWAGPVMGVAAILGLLLTIGTAVDAVRRRVPETRIAATGFAWLAAWLTLDVARHAWGLPLGGLAPIVGFLGLFLALSTALSDRFGRIHRELDALRQHLEERVAERTATIARANQRLQRYLPASLVARLIEAADAPAAPVTERAIATLLFADLQGFTKFSEDLDPQEVTRLLNRWIEAMSDEIGRSGGTLDKMMGDGLMAVWGAPDPMPPEAQARSAFAAASAMQARMPEIFGAGHPFRLRIGIHQDRVAIGNLGTPERWSWTAIGKGVNLAARLESACEPGGILVSETVREKLPEERGFAPPRPYTLKGFREPVLAHQLPPPPTRESTA